MSSVWNVSLFAVNAQHGDRSGLKRGDAMKRMTADESNWNYEIDYIRVWERR